MKKTELKRFKKNSRRQAPRAHRKRQANDGRGHGARRPNDLPDEMDLASSEYIQSFTFRLARPREELPRQDQSRHQEIDDGGFGVCESCDEEISVKRLEARPETTLCIRCKEDQERQEKDFG